MEEIVTIMKCVGIYLHNILKIGKYIQTSTYFTNCDSFITVIKIRIYENTFFMKLAPGANYIKLSISVHGLFPHIYVKYKIRTKDKRGKNGDRVVVIKISILIKFKHTEKYLSYILV